MNKKNRAPIEQLKESAKIANDLAKKRGLIAEESVIDLIEKDSTKPVLPGIPSYLPHIWTLDAARRIMYDLLRIWQSECKGDINREEDIGAFFSFLNTELIALENKAIKEIAEMSEIIKGTENLPVLKDIFSPLRKKQTVRSINKFFVDSLAVSVIVHTNGTTSEYADWFLNDWTDKLYKLWKQKNDSV